MRSSVRLGLVLGMIGAWALVACDRGQDPNNPSDLPPQPTGYDQNGNPIYGQPGGQPYGQPYGTQPQPYGTAAPPAYGTAPPPYGTAAPPPYGTAPPPATAPPAPASPLALPCQSDATCGTHKCNMQIGKCAFPCRPGQSQVDCVAGMGCMAGVCVPGAPQ